MILVMNCDQQQQIGGKKERDREIWKERKKKKI